MIDLLLDIGNTRVKLGLVEDKDYEYLGAYSTQNFLNEDTLLSFLTDLDFKPDHIYVSSVADEYIEMLFRQAIAVKWGLMPVFMSTQLSCCNITNGYQLPFKLGVDRWLSLLGARTFTETDFIVIDAGTAITVDSVINGAHQGGFIVPGLSTLRRSLSQNTALLNDDCASIEPSSKATQLDQLMPSDTQSAICGGTLYMASAFVNTLVVDLLSQSQSLPNIYFTGGDGALLSSLLTAESEYIEDLILLGIVNVKENIKKS